MDEGQGLTPAEKESADIRVNEEIHNPDIQFEPLFSDENVSDAELRGEEPEEEEPPAGDEKTATPESEGDKKPDEKPADEKADEKKADAEAKPEEQEQDKEKSEEPDYSKPPPKGYVPLPAMHEARDTIKSLKEQLAVANQNTASLQAELEQAKTAPKEQALPDEFKDFEVLSAEQFNELVDDDPEEALKYNHKLQRYNAHQAKLATEQANELRRKQQIDAVIQQSVQKIGTVAPGIYDEGSTLANDLFEFAVQSGINENYIPLLTAPATRILPVDKNGNVSKVSYPLGEGAASIVGMLYKFYQSQKESNPETLRAKIKAEVEKEVRESVTKELMQKIKTDPTGFRSISDVPGGSDDEIDDKKVYTERDFANLGEAEQRKILGG